MKFSRRNFVKSMIGAGLLLPAVEAIEIPPRRYWMLDRTMLPTERPYAIDPDYQITVHAGSDVIARQYVVGHQFWAKPVGGRMENAQELNLPAGAFLEPVRVNRLTVQDLNGREIFTMPLFDQPLIHPGDTARILPGGLVIKI